MLGCKPSSEERSAGNPHATFCGSWWRVTATGDPVGAAVTLLPYPTRKEGERGQRRHRGGSPRRECTAPPALSPHPIREIFPFTSGIVPIAVVTKEQYSWRCESGGARIEKNDSVPRS
jgi:hypothetical protein